MDLTFDPALAPCYSAQDCDGAFFSPSSSVVAAVDPDDLLMYYVAPGVLANAGGFHCLRFEGSGGKVQLRSESCGAKLLPVCEADCGGKEGNKKSNKNLKQCILNLSHQCMTWCPGTPDDT